MSLLPPKERVTPRAESRQTGRSQRLPTSSSPCNGLSSDSIFTVWKQFIVVRFEVEIKAIRLYGRPRGIVWGSAICRSRGSLGNQTVPSQRYRDGTSFRITPSWVENLPQTINGEHGALLLQGSSVITSDRRRGDKKLNELSAWPTENRRRVSL